MMYWDKEAGRRIHARLADSLSEFVKLGAFRSDKASSRIERLSDQIRSGRTLAPERFRDYFALLRSVQTKNQRDIERAAKNLLESPFFTESEIAIRPLSDSVFSAAGQRAVRRDFGSESLLSRQITRIPDAEIAPIVVRLRSALDLTKAYAPQSHDLLSKITREIIPVLGRAANGMTFDGCSSVERWGAILINMRIKRSDLILAETLVHESSHSYLFDLTCDSRISDNGLDERYKSPLRIDPRPIDGIFHATFVLAHMYVFLREVADCDAAPGALRDEAKTVSKARSEAFLDGYKVLEEHARLTETGRTILSRTHRLVFP